MKKTTLLLVITYFLLSLLVISCKTNSELPPGPNPPNPPNPPTPGPQEQLVGKIFFHDTGPQSQYDIYMADLFIVPKPSSTTIAATQTKLFNLENGRDHIVRRGVHKFHGIEVHGTLRERVVINTVDPIDISQYDFDVRNLENLTNSTSDDFAVNVNSNNWITFVTAPDGLAGNRRNTEIMYMDIADGIRHRLTPINGQYSGDNWDPDWKTEDIIVWSHDGDVVEVNINSLNVSAPVIPDVDTPQYDPKYSPDGSKILFNTRQGGKKNSWVKYLGTTTVTSVLPANYAAIFADDNPTWIFNNEDITGHIFMDGKGRIYTRNIDTGDFLIITDGERDFRYVTPIMLGTDLYLIFSDWTDESLIALWISNHNGTVLRELNQTGDEVVFQIIGLPVPQSKVDRDRITRMYLDRFGY